MPTTPGSAWAASRRVRPCRSGWLPSASTTRGAPETRYSRSRQASRADRWATAPAHPCTRAPVVSTPPEGHRLTPWRRGSPERRVDGAADQRRELAWRGRIHWDPHPSRGRCSGAARGRQRSHCARAPFAAAPPSRKEQASSRHRPRGQLRPSCSRVRPRPRRAVARVVIRSGVHPQLVLAGIHQRRAVRTIKKIVLAAVIADHPDASLMGGW